MKDLFDKKVVIATVLLVGWLMIYTAFIAPKPEPAPEIDLTGQEEQLTEAEKAARETAAGGLNDPEAADAPSPASAPAPAAPVVTESGLTPDPALPPAVPVSQEAIPVQEVTIDNELITAVLTNRGGRIKSLGLKKYRQTIDKDSPFYDMVPKFESADKLVGGVVFASEQLRIEEDLPMRIVESDGQRVVFEGTSPRGLTLRKEYTFESGKYSITERIKLTNNTGQAIEGRLSASLYQPVIVAPSGGCGGMGCGAADYSTIKNTAYFARRSLERDQLNKTVKALAELRQNNQEPVIKVNSGVFWTGFDDSYFLAALVATSPEQTGLTLMGGETGSWLETTLDLEKTSLSAGESREQELVIYLGPKTKETLLASGYDLVQSLDYGWFGAISDVLVVVLKFFYKHTHNWGIAIILLTFIVKILLYPLTLKSFKSMGEMSRLQPLIKELRERHKNDKTKLNEETMKLYKEHGVNPAGGCLPMLLQFPVFIAFYRALQQSIELRHAGFMFWIDDLAAPDPYFITPIIMGATQWLSQKMTPTSADPAQAKMMQLMPVFFTIMFLNFPSGLVLYWLMNNVLTIAQQKWIAYKNPLKPIELGPAPAPATVAPRKINQIEELRRKKKKGGKKQ